MIYKRGILVLITAIAISLLPGCNAVKGGADAGNIQMTQASAEEKEVIALQAFLSAPDSERIRSLCMKAVAITNAEVAFRWGAVPHMTFSAWRVTRDEKKLAFDKLQSSRIRSQKAIDVSCRLQKIQENGNFSWFLIPTDQAQPLLCDFRKEILRAMDLECEDFDGRSGVEWWPHLTLFSVPVAQEPAAEQIVSEIEKITSIHLSAFAVVGFQEGVHTLVTVQLTAE